ncbi:MAG: carbamoyltransferase [Polyangiaceae bacterium]|nr:carbamoyltransferase [Polyangiaceae bacterium]
MSAPTVYVLGLSGHYHDAAACLLADGEIVAAAQEERFTRRRHDPGFPTLAARWCLDHARIEPGRVDHVVWFEKPVLKLARFLETQLARAPRGLGTFLRAMPAWLDRKLWVERDIEEQLGIRVPALFTEHHQAHAASAFYPSPFEEAAILTLDGVGEWATATAGWGRGGELQLERELRFPHSLGLLYSAFTSFCGFKVDSGEYKLMGLAPYGEPRFKEQILRELVDLREDGTFRLELDYFDFAGGLQMTNERFARAFGGPARAEDQPVTAREMDLAASIQAVTEEIVLRLARDLRERTGLDALCLAGGVALNCVANGRLVREAGYGGLFVQPAAGDAGGALGAALAVWHGYLGRPRAPRAPDALHGALLGPAYDSTQIGTWVGARGVPAARLPGSELVARVVELLEAGKVVGWFQGRMEFGPRALGSRSVLADARRPEMQRLLNLRTKGREGFRPFAPSVLAEDASRWFELTGPSPYMLVTAPVRAEHRLSLSAEDAARRGFDRLAVARSTLPAVTHVDDSARIQTVGPDANPRYRELLVAFRERTGCGLLLNTSFNLRGEPIVCTPEQAYVCFLRAGMDALVLEDWLLLRADQPPLGEEEGAWRALIPPD